MKKIIPVGLLILFLAFSYFLSTNQRLNQFDRWEENPSLYFTDNYPAMTTVDSFYWLRYAKEYNNGRYLSTDNDSLRYYPDNNQSYKKPVPMLSWILAKISTFTNGNYYMAGIYLIPFLAGLFIFPLGIYFYRLKIPAAGVLGGLIGTFSFVYYVRSCTGRVDTDALNTFFPLLASLFILLMSESDNPKKKYIYSALTGLSMALFYWWYAKAGFTLIYFGVLGVMLIIGNRKDLKLIGTCLGIFILFSNPIWFFDGIANLSSAFSRYFSLGETSGVGFPNILKTITEAKAYSPISILSSILELYPIAAAGLILFFILIFIKFKKILPILPVFLLGLLVFKSANRFGMFLAPFAGIGIGFAVHYFWNILVKRINTPEIIKEIFPYAMAILIFFSLKGATAYNYVPGPSIYSNVFKTFIDIKDELPRNSAIYSWWDYGYAIEDVTGFATFHDGGSQSSAKTYFVAKSFVSDSQQELFNTINYLNRKGMTGIKEMLDDNISVNQVVQKVISFSEEEMMNTHIPTVLFTSDMINKYGAFSYIGNWDFDKKNSNSSSYIMLRCSGIKNNILYCGRNQVDLSRGIINDREFLKKSITIVDGEVIEEKNYNFSNGYYLQVLIKGKSMTHFLMNEAVYKSNFNQMYLLGRYDKTLFKEVYNKFPSARAYEVLIGK